MDAGNTRADQKRGPRSDGPLRLTALLAVVAGTLVSRCVDRMLSRPIELEPHVRSLLAHVAPGFVLALFVIMSLQNVGVELLTLIAGLGVSGGALPLAMQGVLSDVAAGLSTEIRWINPSNRTRTECVGAPDSSLPIRSLPCGIRFCDNT
jgi:hypothetical protein